MVRPTKSNKLKEAHNYLAQAEQAHQLMERMRQEPLPPGATRFEDTIVFDETKVTPEDWDKLKTTLAAHVGVPERMIFTDPSKRTPQQEKDAQTFADSVQAQADKARQARIDDARDFVARIQAKNEAHREEVHDGWVVSPEPQFVHLGCSKAEPGTKTVVIRQCPCAVATARDGKEPYCVACKLIVHILNMGEVDAAK